MRKTMKMTLAVLASLALAPTALAATRVGSPISGTVAATTYYSSGAFHGAVDIGNGRCNLDPVLAPFGGYCVPAPRSGSAFPCTRPSTWSPSA
jgi:hypothetical protein